MSLYFLKESTIKKWINGFGFLRGNFIFKDVDVSSKEKTSTLQKCYMALIDNVMPLPPWGHSSSLSWGKAVLILEHTWYNETQHTHTEEERGLQSATQIEGDNGHSRRTDGARLESPTLEIRGNCHPWPHPLYCQTRTYSNNEVVFNIQHGSNLHTTTLCTLSILSGTLKLLRP